MSSVSSLEKTDLYTRSSRLPTSERSVRTDQTFRIERVKSSIFSSIEKEANKVIASKKLQRSILMIPSSRYCAAGGALLIISSIFYRIIQADFSLDFDFYFSSGLLLFSLGNLLGILKKFIFTSESNQIRMVKSAEMRLYYDAKESITNPTMTGLRYTIPSAMLLSVIYAQEQITGGIEKMMELNFVKCALFSTLFFGIMPVQRGLILQEFACLFNYLKTGLSTAFIGEQVLYEMPEIVSHAFAPMTRALDEIVDRKVRQKIEQIEEIKFERNAVRKGLESALSESEEQHEQALTLFREYQEHEMANLSESIDLDVEKESSRPPLIRIDSRYWAVFSRLKAQERLKEARSKDLRCFDLDLSVQLFPKKLVIHLMELVKEQYDLEIQKEVVELLNEMMKRQALEIKLTVAEFFGMSFLSKSYLPIVSAVLFVPIFNAIFHVLTQVCLKETFPQSVVVQQVLMLAVLFFELLKGQCLYKYTMVPETVDVTYEFLHHPEFILNRIKHRIEPTLEDLRNWIESLDQFRLGSREGIFIDLPDSVTKFTIEQFEIESALVIEGREGSIQMAEEIKEVIALIDELKKGKLLVGEFGKILKNLRVEIAERLKKKYQNIERVE